MKVVWATYNFFPERVGGTEVYAVNVARHLLGRGHAVHIVAGSTRSAVSPVEARDTTWENLPVTFVSIRTDRLRWEDLISLESEELTDWWEKWFREHPSDLLHVHGHSPVCSVSLLVAAKKAGLPVAVSLHHTELFCSRGDVVTAWGRPCDGKLRPIRCSLCFGLTKFERLRQAGKTEDKPAATTVPGLAAAGVFGKMRTAAELPKQFYWKRRSLRRQIAQVDGWHVFSPEAKRFLLRNGVADERISIIPHGVDPIPAQRRESSSVVRIGYVGRFHAEKGVGLLIRAIDRIPSELPLRFFFYGQAQDSQEEKVQQEVAALSRRDHRVVLAGGLPPAQTTEVFAGLDLLVIPSIAFETGPLVALEAFRSGVPIIAPRWSGFPSMIRDGVNGLLFPWGNAQALAGCLQRIGREPELLRRLADGIQPPASMQVHVQGLLNFYQRLLG